MFCARFWYGVVGTQIVRNSLLNKAGLYLLSIEHILLYRDIL